MNIGFYKQYSLGSVDIAEEVVSEAVTALIERMVPTYFELIKEFHEKHEILTDYHTFLDDYYVNMDLAPEIRNSLMEAKRIAP